MNRGVFGVSVVCLLILASFTTGEAQNQQRRDFFAILKAGQPVVIKETAGRFQVIMLVDVPDAQSHKVIEVGADYITVEDVAGFTQTRIPVYSVSSIARLKSLKK